MTFSHISNYLPKFSKYLDGADASTCISKMVKKKKGGKELVKFFEKAVKCSEWKSDVAFKSLLDCAVTKSSKLGKKEKAKFNKIEKTFTAQIKGIKVVTSAVQQPIVQQPAQPVKKFTFDEESYKFIKKEKLKQLSINMFKIASSPQYDQRTGGTYSDSDFYKGLIAGQQVALELGRDLATVYLKSNHKTHFDNDEYSEFKKRVVQEFRGDILKTIQDRFDNIKNGVIIHNEVYKGLGWAQIEIKETRQQNLDVMMQQHVAEIETALNKQKVNIQYGVYLP